MDNDSATTLPSTEVDFRHWWVRHWRWCQQPCSEAEVGLGRVIEPLINDLLRSDALFAAHPAGLTEKHMLWTCDKWLAPAVCMRLPITTLTEFANALDALNATTETSYRGTDNGKWKEAQYSARLLSTMIALRLERELRKRCPRHGWTELVCKKCAE